MRTHVYEGPLDLLIELVEKRKLLINDISLANVTDDYLSYVREMQMLSLPQTAEFVQLAATLLLIKSRSLLPVLTLTKEEEASIDDLEERLREYQVFRAAGSYLAERFGERILFGRQFTPPSDPIFAPDEWCDGERLADAMRDVLDSLPKPVVKPTVQVRPTISLEQMIVNLKTRIERELRGRFSDIRQESDEHKTVIVGFLAILELVKQGDILVKQAQRFDDIEFELRQGNTPRYY